MRLLNTKSLTLHEFFDSNTPKYAILSHRWENEETSYQDFEAGKNKDGQGYRKIREFCRRALRDDFRWVWIDTCCIDKKSSAELSEAVNAMFRWYQGSALCYAYLSDVRGISNTKDSIHWPSFERSAWFTRGWTLQELLAPDSVVFFDRDWRRIGDFVDLGGKIQAATGIPIPSALFGGHHRFSVAQKMSWAARRHTSRVEDLAYCLFGLFNVRLPLLYGEGMHAFIRLQEEIIRTSDDESIFAWGVEDEKVKGLLVNETQAPCESEDILAYLGRQRGRPRYYRPKLTIGTGDLLAPDPSCFTSCGDVRMLVFFNRAPYSISNKGLKITTGFIRGPNLIVFPFRNLEMMARDPLYSKAISYETQLLTLNCSLDGTLPVVISLVEVMEKIWIRQGWFQATGEMAEALRSAQGEEVIIAMQWPKYKTPVADVPFLFGS